MINQSRWNNSQKWFNTLTTRGGGNDNCNIDCSGTVPLMMVGSRFHDRLQVTVRCTSGKSYGRRMFSVLPPDLVSSRILEASAPPAPFPLTSQNNKHFHIRHTHHDADEHPLLTRGSYSLIDDSYWFRQWRPRKRVLSFSNWTHRGVRGFYKSHWNFNRLDPFLRSTTFNKPYSGPNRPVAKKAQETIPYLIDQRNSEKSKTRTLRADEPCNFYAADLLNVMPGEEGSSGVERLHIWESCYTAGSYILEGFPLVAEKNQPIYGWSTFYEDI